MPLIDDRGRLLGRMNVIDAAVLLVALGLIPIAYGAFLLFRVPVPKIIAIDPAQVAPSQAGSLKLTGEDLRPFLRARIGATDSPFFVQSPALGEIKLPSNLPAGTYDIALFDEGQELVRKPGALTVIATQSAVVSARIEMQAVGSFVGLAKGDAGLFTVGATLGPHAEVLALRAAQPAIARIRIGPNVFATAPSRDEQRIPAIIALSCAVVNTECKIADAMVARAAIITLPRPQTKDQTKGQTAYPTTADVKFVIDEVFPAGTRAAFPAVATVRVRFVGEPGILNVMKAGDVDLTTSPTATDTERAVLVQIGSEQRTMTGLTFTQGALNRSVQLQEPVLTFSGIVRVPVVFTPSGWVYRDKPVKVGAAFTFETASGAVTGSILDMKIGPERPDVAQ